MKRLVVLLVLLLLLAGGGFAAWTYGKPLYEKMKAEKEKAESQPLYVTMEPLLVPVIEKDTVTHHLTLAISLEVAGLKADEKLREALPRIIDAFNVELYGLMSLRIVRDGGVALPLIKQRLLQVGTRELGEGVITDVLIRSIDRVKGQRRAQG